MFTSASWTSFQSSLRGRFWLWSSAVFQANRPSFFDGVEFPKFIPDWLLFLIGSYVLGHFVSALGSWVMDYLYDGYFKHNFEFRKKGELPSLRRRADHLIMQVLGPELYKEEDNRLTWSESFLILSNAAGAAKLDKQEADCHSQKPRRRIHTHSAHLLFAPDLLGAAARLSLWAPLGILCLALIIYGSHRKPAARRSVDERVKDRLAGLPGGSSTVSAQLRSRLDWPDDKWLEMEKEGTGKRHPDEQDIRLHPAFRVARRCRHDGLSNPRLSGVGCRNGCWVVTVMSAWRFMDLRAKRLAQGYYLTIALSKARAFGGPAATP